MGVIHTHNTIKRATTLLDMLIAKLIQLRTNNINLFTTEVTIIKNLRPIRITLKSGIKKLTYHDVRHFVEPKRNLEIYFIDNSTMHEAFSRWQCNKLIKDNFIE